MKSPTWIGTAPATANRPIPKFKKYELRQERDWCLAEIEVARNGGHCEPHTPEGWEKIMQRRVTLLNTMISRGIGISHEK